MGESRGVRPDGFHLIEKDNDAESRDHLFEMIPVVESLKDHEFEQQSKEESRCERQHQGNQKISGERIESNREVRAQHIGRRARG